MQKCSKLSWPPNGGYVETHLSSLILVEVRCCQVLEFCMGFGPRVLGRSWNELREEQVN